MTTIENLLSVFAISRPRYDDGAMSAEQVLGHAVADHRGQIEIPLVDLTANFWRSPPVDAGDITVTTGLHRLGRRIGTVSALMVADDVPLACAVADIQYVSVGPV